MRPVLVTGFSAFPGVPENPSERLAQAVDGAEVGGHPVHGVVLPVSFARAPEHLQALVEALDPIFVVGTGVAPEGPRVEVHARNLAEGLDVDRRTPDSLGEGPGEVSLSWNAEGLAGVLGARVSRDAGRYVCNAWLYAALTRLEVPAVFVHVPPEGMPAEVLLRGLEWMRART